MEMSNTINLALLKADIADEIQRTGTLSDNILRQYKVVIFPSYNTSAAVYDLLNYISILLTITRTDDTVNDLVWKYNDIINRINKQLLPMNTVFFQRIFEFQLLSYRGELDPDYGIQLLINAKENMATISDIELKINCVNQLLNIYLSDPTKYISNIGVTSELLKTLIALR